MPERGPRNLLRLGLALSRGCDGPRQRIRILKQLAGIAGRHAVLPERDDLLVEGIALARTRTRPGAYRPGEDLRILGELLDDRADLLARRGQPSEAAELADEAVRASAAQLHETWQEAVASVTLEPEYAQALLDHGRRLARIGFRPEARHVLDAATTVYRRLADAVPNEFGPLLTQACHAVSELDRQP